jgi:hypothetical protein
MSPVLSVISIVIMSQVVISKAIISIVVVAESFFSNVYD